MTSSFDQPDDSAAWRWMDGDELPKVRTSEDMLSDLEDACGLLDELASACDRQEKGGWELGEWEPGPCPVADDEPREDQIVCPLPDLTYLSEPLFIASAGHLLDQVALAQSAVSLMIVIGRSKHWPEEFGFLGKPAGQPKSAEQIHNQPERGLGNHFTPIESDAQQSFRCCTCHSSQQQYGLWLRSVEVAGGSLNTKSDLERSSMKTAREPDAIVPVSLGIETNTIYVVFNGREFVRVAKPGFDPHSPASESCKAEVDSGREVRLPNESEDPAKAAMPHVMRRRKDLMWGPHWTQDTTVEENSMPEIDPTTLGINQEDCVDNAAFRKPASPPRALPESDVAQSHLRKNATRSRYPQCSATPGTCRATQPSSHNSAGCHDRRSCTVRGPKGGL